MLCKVKSQILCSLLPVSSTRPVVMILTEKLGSGPSGMRCRRFFFCFLCLISYVLYGQLIAVLILVF